MRAYSDQKIAPSGGHRVDSMQIEYGHEDQPPLPPVVTESASRTTPPISQRKDFSATHTYILWHEVAQLN
jgi:hypothetical protein